MDFLNALTFFGRELSWDLPTALFWLLIAQVALIAFMLIVFAVLVHRVGSNKTIIIEKDAVEDEEKKQETVPAIPASVQAYPAIDADEFYESEIIEDEPVEEPVAEQEQVVEEPEQEEVTEEPIEETQEPVEELAEIPAEVFEEEYAEALPIIEEQPVEETAASVVVEPVVPPTMVIQEDSFEGGTLRYDRSFTARIIQADDDQKSWYTDIKNELLSYKKVHSRISWKRESYNLGRNQIARIAFRGLTMCLYLPLDANDFVDSKFKVEDVSDNASYIDTPCLYRIKNDKRVRYAKELIAMVLEKVDGVKFDREAVDYYLPYEGTVELINKGLIKRNIRSKKDEAIFVQDEEGGEGADAAASEE